MGITPTISVNQASRRVISGLASFAVALTMVKYSAARFDAAKADAAKAEARKAE
jgi:hypothetical protein